jgi:hypothetical protein
MLNKVVLRARDGRLLKGTTTDFHHNGQKFHVTEHETGRNMEVTTARLKAVFFVKAFEGRPGYVENKDMERQGMGKRILVRFKDGEKLSGYTSGYSPDRETFFVFPADPESNNERIMVITDATEEVTFLE